MVDLRDITRHLANPSSTYSPTDLITICDSECQQQEEIANLKQIYLAAKNNMESAPVEYETAKQNYFTLKDGVNGYNEILKKEYTDEGTKKKILMEENFNNHYKTVYIKIKQLQELQEYLPKKNRKEGFEGVPNKSIFLSLPQQGVIASNLTDNITLNNRKSQYELEEYTKLKKYYSIYFIIFYILVVVLLLMLIKKTDVSYFIKFVFIVGVACYPYYISWLIYFIHKGLKYIYKRSTMNIFRKI
jgi:hypothetical protein